MLQTLIQREKQRLEEHSRQDTNYPLDSVSQIPKQAFMTASLEYILSRKKAVWSDHIRCCLNEISTKDKVNIKDDEVDLLSTEVSKHIKVHRWKGCKKLRVNFPSCRNFTDKGITKLLNIICKDLSCLKELSLCFIAFINTANITDDGVRLILQKASRNLAWIKKLELSFRGHKKITDNAFRALCSKALRNMCNLDTFRLDFSRCPAITDKTFKELAHNIRRYLRDLHSLELSFIGCPLISDDSIQSLGSFGAFEKLKSLSLELGINVNPLGVFLNITNEALQTLGSVICKYLPNLQRLSLTFYCCKGITLEGAKMFVSNVCKKLAYLKAFKLDLSGLNCSSCGDFSLEELEAISLEAKQNLVRIKQFQLNTTIMSNSLS